ncbi:ABC transporter substrate-binding protein [Aureimonas endophytica]|uniref:ABC transporter substrate-binding protein n=2 Tax=Aureimonas endophytica TaxID=2027858 RepID=A0A917A4W3_9HYPH|nr:ABC transporter substrate-binding protein [Aureimonas endophytica]
MWTAGLAAGMAAACLLASTAARAHPHVFADARMEIVGDASGQLKAIRNIWRMDEMFSTSVVLDYDKNKNSILDDDELQAVADTVKESIAEYSFYTFVQKPGGAQVKMQPPEEIRALYQDSQLLIFFEMKPAEPVDLKTVPITVANFDETFFTAFEFAEDGFQLVDLPASCTKSVTVPDEDEAAQQWMASIASLGPDQTVPEDGVNYAQILATRVEVKCG